MAKKSKKTAKKSVKKTAKKSATKKKSAAKKGAKSSRSKKKATPGKKRAVKPASKKRTAKKVVKRTAKKAVKKTTKKTASKTTKKTPAKAAKKSASPPRSNPITKAAKPSENSAWNDAKESLAAIGRAAARAVTPNPATAKPKRKQRDQPGFAAPLEAVARPAKPSPPRAVPPAQPTLFEADSPSVVEGESAAFPQAAIERAQESAERDQPAHDPDAAPEREREEEPAREEEPTHDDEDRPSREKDQDDMR